MFNLIRLLQDLTLYQNTLFYCIKVGDRFSLSNTNNKTVLQDKGAIVGDVTLDHVSEAQSINL